MKFVKSLNVLIVLAIVEWIVVIIASYNFSFSKLSYSLPSYEGHLARMAWLHGMADEARNNMTKWLQERSDSNRFRFEPTPESGKSRSVRKKYLCIGVLTMQRQQALFNYLNTIVMALLTRIPAKHHDNISLVILNTDELSSHREELKQLSKLLYIDNITSRVYHPYEKTKEAADYALAMKYLHKQDCSNLLILEDDALAAYDWFQKVHEAIEYVGANYDDDAWMCIKLYTGFQYSDWLLHTPTIFKVLFYSLLLTAVNLAFGETLRKLFTKNPVPYTRRSLLPTAVLFLFVCSLSLNCWLTSISTHPIGDGVKKYSQGRNTVGVIFNPNNVVQLADYLLRVVNDLMSARSDYIRPKDVLMNNFKKANGLVEFIVEPSVFQHIGMHSSLSTRDYRSLEILRGIFKSYSYPDDSKAIQFDPEYWKS